MVSLSFDGQNASTTNFDKEGQISVRNSQRPSDVSTAVAPDRNTIENSIANASHTPAYAIVMNRKMNARASSSPLGGRPRTKRPSPMTSNHSATRLTDSVNSPARNFPNSNASR